MLDESQLKSEFLYQGFRSYYSHQLAADCKEYPFYGGDKEFEVLTKSIKDECGRYSFPCFGDFQSIVRSSGYLHGEGGGDCRDLSKDIELYIIINTKKESIQRFYQYCWMSVEELIDHINMVKLLFEGFEFSVLKDSKNEFMRVKFLFKKNSITFFQVRFLLTWMRYSYEWAISMSTMDAYRLYNHPEYMPKLAKEDIFNLVQITNKLTGPYILSDQVINRSGIPMELKKLKAQVNRKDNSNLCNIYQSIHSNSEFDHLSSNTYDTHRVSIPSKKYLSIAWWEDEDSFIRERLPLYKQHLETLEKNYKYEPAK